MNNGYQRNVTMIDDLPELSDMDVPRPHVNAVRNSSIKDSRYEPNMQGILPPDAANYMKYRRGTAPIPNEAGMASPQQQVLQPGIPASSMEAEQPNEPELTPIQRAAAGPSCLQVADHIQHCPICSKFYKNDRIVYIIVIVILTIICLLLLRKVLNV